MANPPTAEEQVRFLLNIKRLLEGSSFVATYKHALLLSIADVCVERGDDSGARLRVPIDVLAEKFITYYWRQAIPYCPPGRGHAGAVLKQSTGRQAAIVGAVSLAREEYDGSLTRLRTDTQAWRALKRRVAEVIRVMPLWKLQTVGRQKLEFLYAGVSGEGDVIELKEGVCFRTFYSLINELVRSAWLRFVRNINENKSVLGTASDLSDFMFGSGRVSLEVYRPILVEYQGGRCFYCLRPLTYKSDVDHFIPCSRYPVDLGHNFVLAHSTCNAKKADRLAAVEHLERWCRRNGDYGEELAGAFRIKNIAHDKNVSWGITVWAYEQAHVAGSLVWKCNDELVRLTPEWKSLLETPLMRV
ncbi:MAG TPA: HNH endonuclease domain-containing protein [Pyrinomonadaceae bacterium]